MVFLEGSVVKNESEYSHYTKHFAHSNENFLVSSKNLSHQQFVVPESMAPYSIFYIQINCASMEMYERLNIVLYRNIFEEEFLSFDYAKKQVVVQPQIQELKK